MSQRVYNRGVGNASAGADGLGNQPQMLGSVIAEYLNQRLGPKQAQWEALQQLWQELVPEHIAGHCSLADFAGGRLTVAVDSPGYAHELRLLGGDLIKQIQKKMPQLKIKKMTTVLK